MSHYFPDSKPMSVSDLIDVPISIKAVVLDEKQNGPYGIFLATKGNQPISFTTGGKEIMGAIFKMFAIWGIRLERQEIIELPESWDIRLIKKVSKEGKVWIDYESAQIALEGQ